MFILIGKALSIVLTIYAIIGVMSIKSQRSFSIDEIMAVTFLLMAAIWILKACNTLFYQ